MPVYHVDVSGLDDMEREKIYHDLDDWSFFANRIPRMGPIEAVEVFWNSNEDFLTSPVCPKGCPIRKVIS